MHPAFSVIFLTTLIGVGQGLFLALYTGELYSLASLIPVQEHQAFYGVGSGLALVFLVGGLIASIFHLGRPERAWRTATQCTFLPPGRGKVRKFESGSRTRGRVHFFCSAKRNEPKKRPPGCRLFPALLACGGGWPTGHPWPDDPRTRSFARPCGPNPPPAAVLGAP